MKDNSFAQGPFLHELSLYYIKYKLHEDPVKKGKPSKTTKCILKMLPKVFTLAYQTKKPHSRNSPKP